jgi:hypothetical protein
MKTTLLKNKILSCSVLVFLLGAFNVSHAQLNTWVGGTSTDFLDAANWSAATPPATFLNVNTFIIGAGTPNNPILGTAGYTLTSSAPTSGIITITTAGNLTSSGNINVNGACNDDGVLTVNGGIFNVRNNYYVGGTAGTSLAVANVEVGGTLNAKSTFIISQKQPGTINVNGGVLSTDATGSFSIGNYGATYANCLGILNINSGTVKVFKTGGLVIGTVGVVNIDGGKIELTGDQTAAMATYITNSVIKLSTAAAAAGKVLSNTFDSVTGLTTVKATAPMSVKDIAVDNSFSIYPNPSTDGKFAISLPNGFEGAKLSIHNSLGQVIYKTTVENGSSDISPNKSLDSGVYFVQLEKAGNSTTKKLIVK